jgi:hypothetical protein
MHTARSCKPPVVGIWDGMAWSWDRMSLYQDQIEIMIAARKTA